jgi:predicted amidophosphoribosyltransferase
VTTDPFRGLDSRPTGFGTCGGCPYREAGSVSICYPCARQTMRALPRSRCRVCDQELPAPKAPCRNTVCGWPDRQFGWNAAIAMRDGALQQAINRYKYNGRIGWSLIFGRVLAGFLHDRRQLFAEFDLVTASPTFVGPGGRSFDHTGLVLEVAARLDETGQVFALNPPAIRKTGPTTPLVGRSWQERWEICEYELPRSWSPTRR